MAKIPAAVEQIEQRAMGSSGHSVTREQQPPQRSGEQKIAAEGFKSRTRADGKKLRQAPVLFSFRTPGEFIEGKLLRVDPVEIKGKRVTQYTIVHGDATFKILGTYDIDAKLRQADIGLEIEIVYTRDNTEVSRNGNAMKEFDIWVDEAKVPPARRIESAEITDEDIPF